MKSKTMKRFSLKMVAVAFVILMGTWFGIPSYAHAFTLYSNYIGSTLKLGTADYTIQTEPDGDKYVDLPTATASDYDAVLTITAVAVNANAYSKSITPTETAQYSGVWESILYLVDNVKNYKVTYTLTNEYDVVTTASIDVTIASDTPYFEWLDNSEQIIPTQVNRSTEADAVTIVFPYPYIYNGDDEVQNAETLDNETAETADDYEIPIDATGLTVSLAGPNGAEVTISKNTDGYYAWTIPSSSATAPAGTYTVTYEYSDTDSFTIKKEFTFEIVEEAIETSLLINGYSDNSGSASIPTLMSLFVETAFPSPVVVNTKADKAEVDVYTEITLVCKPTDTATYGSSITYNASNTPSLRELKFTPTVAGKYSITYKVTDFFGNTQTFVGDHESITATKTSASGSGYIVSAYDGTSETILDEMTTQAEDGTIQTVEYTIPSIVAKDSTWTIPALFGIDKLYGYEDLNFERTVTYTKTGDTSSSSNVYSSTQSGVYEIEPYETIDYTFSYEGTYKWTFKVKDGAGNSLLNVSYNVQVEDGYTDTTAPSITMTGLTSSVVYSGSTLSFTVSASDYRTDDEDTVADDKIHLIVEYKYGTETEWTTLTKEDGVYTIDVSANNGATLTIKATATDDYAEIDTPTTVATTKEKTITIKNYSSDGVSPVMSSFTIGADLYDDEENTLKTFETGDTITLPAITVTDNNPNLFVTATVQCNGTTISGGTFSAYSVNAKKVVMGGEQFIAHLTGTYVVTYKATDVNGNTSYKMFTFEVEGPQVPIINLGTFDTTYEYGTSIDLANLSVSVNTAEVDYTNNIITNIKGSFSEEEIIALINTLIEHAQSATSISINNGGSFPTVEIGGVTYQIDLTGGKLLDNAGLSLSPQVLIDTDDNSFTLNGVLYAIRTDDSSNLVLWSGDYASDLVDYGDVLDSIVVQINGGYLLDSSNPNSIIAGQSGNVTLKYWAVSSTGEFDTTPKVVTFATEDTTQPIVVINNGGPVSTFAGYDADASDEANRVQIPNISSATDLSGVQTPTITAKYDNATKDLTIVQYAQDSIEYANGYYGYFVANDDGYVTVTYSVSDNASPANTTTLTYKIGIGDISAPQISITALQNSLETEYNIGDTLTLDLTLLTVTDADSIYTASSSNTVYEHIDIVVTLDGTDITDDDLSDDDASQMIFTLDTAGTYVITFNTTDSAGNVATQKTITITVADETTENVASTTVWGTILIIVALVALGIVIYFFVKPSKVKTTGKATVKKDDEKKDKKDDKIVV